MEEQIDLTLNAAANYFVRSSVYVENRDLAETDARASRID